MVWGKNILEKYFKELISVLLVDRKSTFCNFYFFIFILFYFPTVQQGDQVILVRAFMLRLQKFGIFTLFPAQVQRCGETDSSLWWKERQWHIAKGLGPRDQSSNRAITAMISHSYCIWTLFIPLYNFLFMRTLERNTWLSLVPKILLFILKNWFPFIFWLMLIMITDQISLFPLILTKIRAKFVIISQGYNICF